MALAAHPGDRVCLIGYPETRGTVAEYGPTPGMRIVRWDVGGKAAHDVRDLVRSPDDGPEGLKSLLRF